MPRTRRIRTRLAAAGGCVALALSTVACASVGSGSGGTINLTYAMWRTPEQAGYQQSINAFEKQHPNIHVTIESFAYADYESKLTTEFSSGGGPDVYWVNTPMIATWAKDGVITDLTSKVTSAHIDTSQYLPQLLSMHQLDGKLYGLPKDWDTIAYYYNADYFAQHHITIPANLTWNPADGGTWLQFLRQLTYDTRGNNAASPAFDPASIGTYGVDSPNQMQWGFEPYLAENGVKIIDKPGVNSVAFDTPAGKQTFQFLSDLIYRYHVAIPGAALGTDGAADNTEDETAFAQGKVAMIENGDWQTAGLQSEVKFHVGVLPLPTGPLGNWTVINGLIDAINSHTPNADAAWQLEQWLASSTSQRVLGSGGYIWPGISSLDPLYADYWKQHGIDMTPFLTESHWNVVEWPITPGMDQAQQDIANQLAPAYLSGGNVGPAVDAAAHQADDDLSSAG